MRKIVSLSVALAASLFSLMACSGGDSTMTDARDGRTYKTTQLGDQVWMAENLNYKAKDSWCYEDKDYYCFKYGRLYSWNSAKDACPSGWHLPSKEDLEKLVKFAGGNDNAGSVLKSNVGWNEKGNAQEAQGFLALPGGYRNYGGNFNYEGDNAFFWTSTEYEDGYAYSMNLNSEDMKVASDYDGKDYGYSVRCVMDGN